MEQVQEAFGETMTSVVSLCARYPIACANSIGLLCTIPYTRYESTSYREGRKGSAVVLIRFSHKEKR